MVDPSQLQHPPPSVEVVRNGPDLHVAIRWSSRHGVALLGLATVLVPLNLYLGTRGLAALVTLATGCLAYLGAALRFNTTLIEVVGHELSVRHAPLPWPGARSIPTTSLRGLQVVSRDRGGEQVWDLLVQTRYGQVPLITGFEGPEIPAYLQALLDEQLTGA